MRWPSSHWATRGMAITAGFAWLLWLGYEDRGLSVVANLAGLLALAGGGSVLDSWARDRRPQGRLWRLRPTLVGLAAGTAVGPVAILLMLIKTSLHGHGIPDFEPEDMRAVLLRVPLWMASGLLGGAGIGLLLSATRSCEGPDSPD